MTKTGNRAVANPIGLRTASLALFLLLVSGCASQPRPQALLLVSLDDGSVIRQDIDLDADVCMKVNDDAATTCYTRGDPILSADQLQVIGYRMDRSEISLYPD